MAPQLCESIYNSWVVVDNTHAVFNSRTGNLVTMPSHHRDAVTQFLGGAAHLDHDVTTLLADLIKTGVLVSTSTDELAMLGDQYENHRNGNELQLTIVTSLGCNFDCAYCFEDKRPSKLRPEVADAIVAFVANRPELSRLFVTWFGGEPLMATNELVLLSERLRELCRERDAAYSSVVITNGWYLDKVTAERLVAAGVPSAQVTIDGPREINDSHRPHVNPKLSTYDRIVENLQEAADVIDIVVRVNLDRSNTPHLEELLANLKALDLAGRVRLSISQITGGGCDDEGNPRFTRDEFAKIETAGAELARFHGFGSAGLPRPMVGTPCTAVNRNDLVVGPGGELWKCWDDVGHNRLLRGNLLELATTAIDIDDWLDESPFRDDQCRSCVALPVCMGGCPSRRRNGTRDDQCGTFRHNHTARITNFVSRLLDESGTTDERAQREHARASISAVVANTANHRFTHQPVPVPVSIGRRPVSA